MVIHWIIFSVMILLIPFAFICFKIAFVDKLTVTEQQKKNANLTTGKYILLFWLYDFLYMAIFNQWLVLEYILGVLSIIIIFTNLTRALLSENKIIMWMLPFDLVLGIGLSVYLIYILPEPSLQTIMTAIISAIYGGIITLVGVAWTIKHNKDERKQDEIEANRPIIFPFNPYNDFDSKKLLDILFVDDNQATHKYVGMIKNTDKAVLLLKEIIVDGVNIPIKYGDVLDKNMVAQIIVTSSKQLEYNSIILVGSDIRGNIIKYEMELKTEKKEIQSIKIL